MIEPIRPIVPIPEKFPQRPRPGDRTDNAAAAMIGAKNVPVVKPQPPAEPGKGEQIDVTA